jgi:hypothetical protein
MRTRRHESQPRPYIYPCVLLHRDRWEPTLFTSAGIDLVQGWLIDPESPEDTAVSRVQDYDSAMNLIVEADVLTRGMLVALLTMVTEQDPARLDQAVQM